MSLPSLSPLAPPPPRRSLRVLYADDLAELRDVVAAVLSADGHTVDTAANGHEAWKRIFTAPAAYDLIVTDHNMPAMDGLEFVTQLRDLAFRGRIVVLSSDQRPELAARYRALGVEEVLAKPVAPQTLRRLAAAG